MPAGTLKEAYQAADPRPLVSGNPYFVDLGPARQSWATNRMKMMIENCAETSYAAIAFSGHRGSGKSTELKKLQEELAASCFPIYLDVYEFLDPADVAYTDLFLLLSRRLLDQLREHNVQLSGELLKAVEDWFKKVTKETEESVSLSAGIATEAKAGVELPFIAKLLAKLTAEVKAGSSHKQSTREELDRYFSGLLNNTNIILQAASDALHDAGRASKILIVVDNLDRLPPDKSEQLFFGHGSQLQDLACHAVYTVSIDTFYSPRLLGHVFSNHLLLPNVKLRKGKSDTAPNAAGINGLTEVVSRRIDIDKVFQDRELTARLVSLSGGSVRQLIRMIREAVLSAQSRQLQCIDATAIEDAARSLRHDFERSLTPENYTVLAATAQTKSIQKDERAMQLLSNMAILEYNGSEVWYDVNPLIESIDAYRSAKDAAAQFKG